MRSGPGTPPLQLSDALVTAVAVEGRRLEVMGRDAYINAGRQDDNIVAQMVIIGTITDAYVIEQQYESHVLKHASLPETPGVKGGLMPVNTVDLLHCELTLMEEKEAEKRFLTRGLQWAVRQEAAAEIQLNCIQLSAVDVLEVNASDPKVATPKVDTSKAGEPPPTAKGTALEGVGLTAQGEKMPVMQTEEVEAAESAAELADFELYLKKFRDDHFAHLLPQLRPEAFPEHLWTYVEDRIKPMVKPNWELWRFEELMGEIAGIDISSENEARKRQEPYLRAQAYANLAVYGHPDPNNQPTIDRYSYDIELSDTTPVRSKMRIWSRPICSTG
jgi:hypothetical protein